MMRALRRRRRYDRSVGVLGEGLAATRFVRDEKMIEGRDGFLFMANDNNHVLAQHSGELRLDEAQLAGWRTVLERRTEMLAQRGCAHLVMIAPNNHSVYPEKLPRGIDFAPERPVHQLSDHLAATGAKTRLIHPLAEMVAGKREHLVCSRTDSHWTDFGAFLAYERLLEDVRPVVETRYVELGDLIFMDIDIAGDLGLKFDPERNAPQPFARMRYYNARLIYDNTVDGTGCVAVTDCDLAPHTTCLLLGDSCAYVLAKFLAESFRRLVFAHAPNLDPAVVEATDPDVAISVIAERFLIAVPDDVAGRPMRERERGKREAGRTRPPLQYWTWPMLISPGPVEMMRARLLAEGRLMDATLISVMAYAGLRPHEALTLRWSAVERDAIVVRPGQGNPQGKARRVPLWRPLAEDLQEWRRLSGRGGDQLVFVGENGPLDLRAWREHTYADLARAAGLENRVPAFLRTVFCVLLINAGIPIDELAALVDMEPSELAENFKDLWEKAGGSSAMSPDRAIAHARMHFAR